MTGEQLLFDVFAKLKFKIHLCLAQVVKDEMVLQCGDQIVALHERLLPELKFDVLGDSSLCLLKLFLILSL